MSMMYECNETDFESYFPIHGSGHVHTYVSSKFFVQKYFANTLRKLSLGDIHF